MPYKQLIAGIYFTLIFFPAAQSTTLGTEGNNKCAQVLSTSSNDGLNSSLEAHKNIDSFEEFEELMSFATSHHPTYSVFNNSLHSVLLERYPEVVDPYRMILFEKSVKNFKGQGRESLLNLLKEFKDRNFYRFKKLLRGHAQNLRSVYKILNNINSHKKEIEDLLNNSFTYPESFPKNLEDVTQRTLMNVAYQVKRYMHFDMDKQTALFLASRELQRQLQKQFGYFSSLEEKIFVFMAKAGMSSLDAHSDYYTHQESEEMGMGLQNYKPLGVQMIEHPQGLGVEKVTPESLASFYNFYEGDIIIAIGDESLAGKNTFDFRKIWSSASENNQTVVFKVQRQGQILEITVEPSKSPKQNLVNTEVHQRAAGNILHLSFPSYYQGSAEDIQTEIEKHLQQPGLNGIVLDLRNNGGGRLDEAAKIMSLFTHKPGELWFMTGKDKIKQSQGENLRQSYPTPTIYKGPLMIMINGGSASASELTSGTLRHRGRALIVGTEQSFGKGTSQLPMPYPLPKRPGETPPPLLGAIKVTTSFFHTDGGESPQYQGVKSDIELKGPQFFLKDHLERTQPQALKPPRVVDLLREKLETSAEKERLNQEVEVLKSFHQEVNYDDLNEKQDPLLEQSLEIFDEWLYLKEQAPQ